MKNENIMKDIYNYSYEYLKKVTPDGVNLNQYLYVEKKYSSLNEVLFGMCISLQNYQRMPNVIGLMSSERKLIFKEILYNYDSNEILNKYKCYDELLNEFKNKFKLTNINFSSKNNSWVKYSKSILSASKFIQNFNNTEDFDKFVNIFSYNETTAAALPMILSKEIYGLGFALSCDFLKELGYCQYPKPDVHIIDIFSELGLSDKNEYECYKQVIKMANLNNVTPYTVDKIFWLIGSGRFYDDPDVPVKSHKKDFIENAKGNLLFKIKDFK